MIRVINMSLLVLGVSLLGALYHIRYSADAEVRHLQKLDFRFADAIREQQMLRAEWASLNDPARLQKLSEKHLGLVYASSDQMIAATQWRQSYFLSTREVVTAEVR